LAPKTNVFLIQRGGAVTLIERLGLSDSTLTEGSPFSQPQNLLGLLSPDVVDAMLGKAFPSLQGEVAQWIQQSSPAFTVKPLKVIAVPAAILPAPADAAADDNWLASVASDGYDNNDFDDDNAFAEDSSARLSQDNSAKALTMNDSRALSEAVSLEDRLAAGGWFVEGYYLYYRPAGHADQLIVVWLDYIVSKIDSASELGKPMLASFANKDNPGSCFKCHSVEADPHSESCKVLKVNWRGAEAAPNVQDFKRFKRQSHFAVVEQSGKNIPLLGDGGCISCHKSNDSEGSSNSYEQMDASIFESEFGDLGKATCVNYHQADAGLAACALCHNYHIGESGLIQLSDSFSRYALAPASHDSD
jgi:hypothetical protein